MLSTQNFGGVQLTLDFSLLWKVFTLVLVLALKRWQFFKSGTLLWFNSADTNSFAVFESCLVFQFVLHSHVGMLWSRVRCYTRCQPYCKDLLLLSKLCVSAHTNVQTGCTWLIIFITVEFWSNQEQGSLMLGAVQLQRTSLSLFPV